MGWRRLTAVALMVVALGAWQPAPAGAADSRAVAQPDPAAIPAKELRSFANAARAVFRIRQAYAPKVQAAHSEMDARDFIVAAQKEMEGAIRREGMTVSRYNDILKLAQRDAALAGRIQELVDKAAREEKR
jgi:hypothetical protein